MPNHWPESDEKLVEYFSCKLKFATKVSLRAYLFIDKAKSMGYILTNVVVLDIKTLEPCVQ